MRSIQTIEAGRGGRRSRFANVGGRGGPPAERVHALQRNVGNRAVAGLMATTAGRRAIQRLIAPEHFKARTRVPRSGRGDLKKLDKWLKEYAGLLGGFDDVRTRHALLLSMRIVATEYLSQHGAGPRADGVKELLGSVQTELSFIDPLVQGLDVRKSHPDRAFELSIVAQDAYRAAQRKDHPEGFRQEPDFPKLSTEALKGMGDQDDPAYRDTAMKKIIAKDLAHLEAMAADTNASPTMRKILDEILANRGKTYYQETKQGASGAVLAGQKDRNRGITEKYRVDVNLQQGEGSAARISSLVHEMTHVSVQESFANTAIHLAFLAGDADEDVLELSLHRTDQLDDLLKALAKTKWTPSQRGLLDEKIRYPTGVRNTLGSYATTFHGKGELTDAQRDRVLNLERSGANNTLIEFDTVINQMMFLMSAWNVPEDNEFYKTLTAIADEAYEYRKRGRVFTSIAAFKPPVQPPKPKGAPAQKPLVGSTQ